LELLHSRKQPSGTPGRDACFCTVVCAPDASGAVPGPVAVEVSMQAAMPHAAAKANQGAKRRDARTEFFGAGMYRSYHVAAREAKCPLAP
jgi:hypothetical protein